MDTGELNHHGEDGPSTKALYYAVERISDLERRLGEANALLGQVYRYVDQNNLAKLGQSRVKALIDSHEYVAHKLSRYSMDAGHAEQRQAESRAVRKALGFGEDADDVSPRDLLEAIKKLKREAL